MTSLKTLHAVYLFLFLVNQSLPRTDADAGYSEGYDLLEDEKIMELLT
jgi:hypothetical protein